MRLGDLDALQKEFEELARIVAYCDRERERDAAVRVKCAPTIDPETLPIVKELRAENKKLTEALGDSFALDLMNKLDKAEKERDAAIEELQGECFACKNHSSFPGKGKCKNCRWDTNIIWLTPEKYQDNWEWHGIQED